MMFEFFVWMTVILFMFGIAGLLSDHSLEGVFEDENDLDGGF